MDACVSKTNVSGASSSTRDPKSSTQPTTAKSRQQQKTNDKKLQRRKKRDARQHTGAIPCGKRRDFGYNKDFNTKYSIGKLVGHGQFGYTYVATNKTNGDRVAVKRIEKIKEKGFAVAMVVVDSAVLVVVGIGIALMRVQTLLLKQLTLSS